MSLASLEAFLEQAHTDTRLQELLCAAPDAAAVAAIAQAAGYPVSELDLWQASAISPEELHPAAPDDQPAHRADLHPGGPTPEQELARAIPDPWLEDDPLTGFLHQAQGDEALQRALATAADAAAVAAIAQAAGYPVSELDLWQASGGVHADDLLPPEPDLSPIEAPLARFLLMAEHDPDLQEALTNAEDAAAVAAIARAAGFPITVADLWAATEAVPQELVVEEWTVVEIEEVGEWA